MLDYLHIKNLALIDDMSLEFTDGINVLTGETGAGKSFILKALSFILGDKLGTDIIRPGAEKAQVEALFLLDGKELLLRRELLQANGRSRFYVNDVLSSQETLRELRQRLVSHTSQHAQHQLLNQNYQAILLESYLDAPDELQKRKEILADLNQVEENIKALLEKQKDLAEKREFLEMQAQEIDKVNPKPGEEEELEKERAQIRAQAGLRQNYNKALALLHGDDNNGLLQKLTEFQRIIQQMSAAEPSLSGEVENLESLRQTLIHLGNSLPKPASRLKINADAIEERLFAFAQLKRKLKRSFVQVLELKQQIKDSLSFLDASALDLAALNRSKKALLAQLRDNIASLQPLRKDAADKFAAALEKQLVDLGFSEHARVVPEFEPYPLKPGIEDVKGRIFWAPNPGQKPMPLDKIASGGELSRFLLALNTLEKPDKDLTYIFDEVDAGVGGMTLNKVGEKLEALGAENQVLLITHWPQLAARAKNHFLISKSVNDGNTYTRCTPLTGNDRKKELERMAGGTENIALLT